MKNNKKMLMIPLLSLLLFSCGENDNNYKDNTVIKKNLKIEGSKIKLVNSELTKEIKTKEIKKEIKFQNKKEEINYNKIENKLQIGKNVFINELKSKLPDDIKIYNSGKVYINSNVKNYLFFVLNKKEKIYNIGKYYISYYENLGYERIIKKEIDNIEEVNINNKKINEELGNIKINNKEKKEDLSRLEFVLKNDKYKLGEDGFSINGEKEFKQKILININDSIPKIIEENMGLKGMFIEIYYNQN